MVINGGDLLLDIFVFFVKMILGMNFYFHHFYVDVKKIVFNLQTSVYSFSLDLRPKLYCYHLYV